MVAAEVGSIRLPRTHDLRQPLATIRALVASLKSAEVSPEALRWHLDNMEEQVDRLGDFVCALLATVVAEPDGRRRR
jgi:K+-sensing histidine kinase KdpD